MLWSQEQPTNGDTQMGTSSEQKTKDINTKWSTKVLNELRYIRDIEHHFDINPMKTLTMGNPTGLRNRKKRKHSCMGKLVVNKQLLLPYMLTKIKTNTYLSERFKCEQCPRRTTMAIFKKNPKQLSNSDPEAKVMRSGASSIPCLQGRCLELPQHSARLLQLPSMKS